MTYIFKYHPDNWIGINGAYYKSYDDFIIENPEFPIIEGQYFEYFENKLEIINNINGTFVGFIQSDLTEYQHLITAINTAIK